MRMLNQSGRWATVGSSPVLPLLLSKTNTFVRNTATTIAIASSIAVLKLSRQGVLSCRCNARRRVRYDDEDVEDEEGEPYGYNKEIAMLELYSESARGEAVIVHALVDGEEVEVLVFKGFSSCLSYATSPDPSRSVIPGRAVIKSIDRIKGPFDPSNIEYLEKGLTWNDFKARISPT